MRGTSHGGERSDPIYGDGGPLVVLQASAAARWQGALGSEDDLSEDDGDIIEIDAESAYLYAPGEVAFESDSEAAFLCGDCITWRYGRDMLVLGDSEWGSGRIFALPTGQVVIVQRCYYDDQLPDMIDRAASAKPERSFPFKMEDTSLRLLVGADDGQGESYGYMDAPIVPGQKQCDLYRFDDGLMFILTDASSEPSH